MAGTRGSGENERTSPEIAEDESFGDRARVVVLWEGGSAKRWLAPGAQITIGRSSSCDICVDHRSVSRAHALLLGGSPVRVQDLGSSNGVRVRGARIEPNQSVAVNPGDVVELGSVVVVVQGPATSAPSSTDGTPLRRLLALVAKSELSVVIVGETGVGKNLAAQWIHDHSPRADKPFVPLNCAAIPEAMIEGELFGYEKGAFTGAARAKAGLVESADGGTLLLDEIGELSLATQAKLLGVLENREVLRLGSLQPRRVDVRLLAATNRDLDALVREGRFRADLHFRLNGITVAIPPLRERRDEIPELALLFLERACTRAGRAPLRIASDALASLRAQSWPGNIRELRNTMERAAALCTDDVVRPEHLAMPRMPAPTPASAHVPAPAPAPATDAVASDENAGLWGETEARERQRVLEALERSGGNQTQAAKLLGISRRALINRIELHGLPRPRKGKA